MPWARLHDERHVSVPEPLFVPDKLSASSYIHSAAPQTPATGDPSPAGSRHTLYSPVTTRGSPPHNSRQHYQNISARAIRTRALSFDLKPPSRASPSSPNHIFDCQGSSLQLFHSFFSVATNFSGTTFTSPSKLSSYPRSAAPTRSCGAAETVAR